MASIFAVTMLWLGTAGPPPALGTTILGTGVGCAVRSEVEMNGCIGGTPVDTGKVEDKDGGRVGTPHAVNAIPIKIGLIRVRLLM